MARAGRRTGRGNRGPAPVSITVTQGHMGEQSWSHHPGDPPPPVVSHTVPPSHCPQTPRQSRSHTHGVTHSPTNRHREAQHRLSHPVPHRTCSSRMFTAVPCTVSRRESRPLSPRLTLIHRHTQPHVLGRGHNHRVPRFQRRCLKHRRLHRHQVTSQTPSVHPHWPVCPLKTGPGHLWVPRHHSAQVWALSGKAQRMIVD